MKHYRYPMLSILVLAMLVFPALAQDQGLTADELLVEGQVEELDWDTLIPEGFNPEEIFESLGDIGEMSDDDPRVEEVMAKIQVVLDEAPIVEELDGKLVKLPGFVVPLEGNGKAVSEFLLVPYYGACIHVPPPPANQTVYVKVPAKNARIREAFDTVWVTGTLSAKSFDSDLATAGYILHAQQIDPYDE